MELIHHRMKPLSQSNSRIIPQSQAELSAAIHLLFALYIQTQSTLTIDTDNYAINLIHTCNQRYGTSLPEMVLLPLLLDGGKPPSLMTLQIGSQNVIQTSNQMVTVHQLTSLQPDRSPLLINVIGALHIHIDSNTQNHVAYICRITH
ncbi:hypothetical protein BLX41_06600 [Pseudomonas protegens]|nr:hypothetical protein BLX41_06600 [Pseudomonas protegens]